MVLCNNVCKNLMQLPYENHKTGEPKTNGYTKENTKHCNKMAGAKVARV